MAGKIDLDLLDELLNYLKRKGAPIVELYAAWGEDFSVSMSEGELEYLERSEGGGVGIRILDEEGRMGFAHANNLDLTELKKAGEEALSKMPLSSSDRFRKVLPPKGDYPDPQVFDDGIFSISEGERLSFVKEIHEKAKEAHPLVQKVRRAEYSDGWYETALLNSFGTRLLKKGTYFSCDLAVLASKGKDREMGYYSQERRFLRELDVETVIHKAVDRAVSLIGGKRLKTRKASLVFSPEATADFISLLSSLISAENVQKGKSLLIGKLGKRVASECVSIVDDGTLDGGIGSAPFDGEGFPTRRKMVIDRGVLMTYLHNTYTAAKDGVETTGNAVRGYSSVPAVGSTNLFIMPGERNSADILGDVKEGLYVLSVMGLHTVNLISGDFSLGVSGLWIDNGEKVFPVRGMTIAGNLLEFFNSVEEVGNDLQFFRSVGGATLKVGDLTIGGE
ncbi:MAG: TldD/PmbA family protein [Synergistetes bacterium]|nr:TldD/PmbA family protein [Synergistota bacterium]